MSKINILLVFLTSLIVVSCSNINNDTDIITPAESLSSKSPVSSPAIHPSNGSPLLTERGNNKIIAFELEKPILKGQEIVSGKGTSGVPIFLEDISLGGDVLASTIVNYDGDFTFSLLSPLLEGHRVGLRLGDLEGTGYSEEYFRNNRFNGNESRSIPQLGFFFDTALIK